MDKFVVRRWVGGAVITFVFQVTEYMFVKQKIVDNFNSKYVL